MKKILVIALAIMMVFALTATALAANQDGNSQGGSSAGSTTQSGAKSSQADYNALGNTLGKGVTVSFNSNNQPVVKVAADADLGIFTLITKDQDGNNAWLKFEIDTANYLGKSVTLKVQSSSKNVKYSFVLSHECAFDEVVTAPTCTADGFTTFTCECGLSYEDNKINALGHTSGEPVTTLKATCIAEGAWKICCTACEDLLEEGNIAEDPNNHAVTSLTDYDALAAGHPDGGLGYVWAACSDCGAGPVLYSYELWVALGGNDFLAPEPEPCEHIWVAFAIVSDSVRNGFVWWSACEECGEPKPENPSYDYDAWLALGGPDFLAGGGEEGGECEHVWIAVALAPGYGNGWVWWSNCEKCNEPHPNGNTSYDYDAWIALGGPEFEQP